MEDVKGISQSEYSMLTGRFFEMRRTKIICTLGPAVDDEKILRELMVNGMNAARCNFSHGCHEEHKQRIDRFKKVRDSLKLPIPLL